MDEGSFKHFFLLMDGCRVFESLTVAFAFLCYQQMYAAAYEKCLTIPVAFRSGSAKCKVNFRRKASNVVTLFY